MSENSMRDFSVLFRGATWQKTDGYRYATVRKTPALTEYINSLASYSVTMRDEGHHEVLIQFPTWVLTQPQNIDLGQYIEAQTSKLGYSIGQG